METVTLSRTICDPLRIIRCTGAACDRSVLGSATNKGFRSFRYRGRIRRWWQQTAGLEVAANQSGRSSCGSKGGPFKKGYPTAGCFTTNQLPRQLRERSSQRCEV